MKILTFDIEEWFHVLDNPATQSVESWKQYPSRLRKGVDAILELLDETSQPATFFCLGWVAEKHPRVIKEIDAAGYHIASHSYAHQLAYTQSRSDFREDLHKSVAILQDITGKSVETYRAPGFSITSQNLWAFEILIEEGISVDCSLFPANRAHGGLPGFGVAHPSIGCLSGNELKLFPINTKSIFGRKIIYSGGGYFRILPNRYIQRWFGENSYVMTYFHPRDFDSEQPIIPGLNPIRRFKSYVGIKGAKLKLANLLSIHKFVDVRDAEKAVHWNLVPRVDLRTGVSL